MKHKRTTELRYPGLWRGCVGAWAPCLGPTGLTLRDWSGKSNHGVLTSLDAGSCWGSVSGRNAITGNNSSGYVNCGNITKWNVGAGAYTLHVWVSGGTNGKTLFAKSNTGGANGFYFANRTASGNYYWYDGTVRDIGAKSNAWNLLTATRRSTGSNDAFLYFNGQRVVTFTDARTISNPSVISMLGLPGETFGAASIGDVSFYDQHETSALIQLRYAIGCGGMYQTIPRRRASSAVAFNRRRRLLVGAHS